MITYNDLYEILRKEKYSEKLQVLPKNFMADIREYFQEKKKISEKGGDLFSDTIKKSKKQLENAVSIFKELMLRRKKKLLDLAFLATETGITKRDYENMLEHEKKLFDKLADSIGAMDKEIFSFMNGELGEEQKKNEMVVFKKDVDEFLGLDGEKLGPFKEGEIANLDKEIVKI